jgi:hypothetical protein
MNNQAANHGVCCDGHVVETQVTVERESTRTNQLVGMRRLGRDNLQQHVLEADDALDQHGVL